MIYAPFLNIENKLNNVFETIQTMGLKHHILISYIQRFFTIDLSILSIYSSINLSIYNNAYYRSINLNNSFKPFFVLEVIFSKSFYIIIHNCNNKRLYTVYIFVLQKAFILKSNTNSSASNYPLIIDNTPTKFK